MATRQREKRDASPGLKMQRFTVPFPFGSECGANSGSLYASSLLELHRARAMFSKRLLLSYIALVRSLELASDDGGGRALPNAETPSTLATMYSNNNTLLRYYVLCNITAFFNRHD